MVDWGVVSEQVLGRSLSVWNEIMREMFLNRVKVSISLLWGFVNCQKRATFYGQKI